MRHVRAPMLIALCLLATACAPVGRVDEAAPTPSPVSEASPSAPEPLCGDTFPFFPTEVPGLEAGGVDPEGRSGEGPRSLPAEEGQLVSHWQTDFDVVIEMRWPGTAYVEDTDAGESFDVAGHPAYAAPRSPSPDEGRLVVQVSLADPPDRCSLLSVDSYGPIPDAVRDTARAFAEGLRPRSELEEHIAELRETEERRTIVRLCPPSVVEPGPGEMVVEVSQICREGTGYGRGPFAGLQPVERAVPATSAPLRAALEQLLPGPTRAEEEAGLYSWFSPSTADALRGVDLRADGLAVIDLEAAPIRALDNVSTSTGGAYFRGQIRGTAFRFPSVRAVEVRLDGSPEAFCTLMEAVPDCNPLTRTPWIGGPGAEEVAAPTPEDVELVLALVRFAGAPSSERLASVPLGDQVWLGLGTELVARRHATELRDPRAWTLEVEHHAGAVGPFSALERLEAPTDLRVSVGPHRHCASPPRPAPSALSDLRRVAIQPADHDSCLQWWTVDLFLDAADRVEAVTLDFWEP